MTASAVGQTDSTIIGKYTFVQQKGIHVVPGISYGDFHPTSYISHVDTTITKSVQLDSHHNSVLQIDTAVGVTGFNFAPELKWHGKWELINDTLIVKLTELSTYYPNTISFDGEKEVPIIENLRDQIVLSFVIKTYDNRIYGIYGLELINEEETITYRKQQLFTPI
jgi:hypothetical protein